MVNQTHNGIKVGDKIECENDRDQYFTGYVTAIVNENMLIFKADEDLSQHNANATWCTVIYDCDDCHDTGEIIYDEFDPDSNEYMRGTGVRTCHCQKETFDEQI